MLPNPTQTFIHTWQVIYQTIFFSNRNNLNQSRHHFSFFLLVIKFNNVYECSFSQRTNNGAHKSSSTEKACLWICVGDMVAFDVAQKWRCEILLENNGNPWWASMKPAPWMWDFLQKMCEVGSFSREFVYSRAVEGGRVEEATENPKGYRFFRRREGSEGGGSVVLVGKTGSLPKGLCAQTSCTDMRIWFLGPTRILQRSCTAAVHVPLFLPHRVA